MPAIVSCLGLTKTFRDFWMRSRVTAVDHVDLDIQQGELFGLLGPNGSGKSTTIKMILGLLYPTAGRVAVFNQPPTDTATKRRIGYLPEESYLYKFLTGRETLHYYAQLFGLPRGQRNQRIDTLLEMVGLEHAARRPVGEYSKGMQRKIGLAQALINDPDLLILDEPTSGMDPIATADVKRILARLRERGKTIILCSHLLAEVEDVCDRAAIMFGGKIREMGPIDDLLTLSTQTTIQTDTLDDAALADVEATLERHGHHIEGVQRPRQRLEALFLDIVAKAQAEGATTSGATSGGRIAGFLDQDAQAENVIQRLTSPEAHAPAEAASAAAAQIPQGTEAPKHEGTKGSIEGGTGAQGDRRTPARTQADSRVIASLTGDAAAGEPAAEASGPSQSPRTAPPAPTPPPQEDADRSLIDSLIDKDI